MGQKLFRDPLYDYIQIDKKESWILDLINTPEFQRLRFISQLGLSNLTYPGSTHSRFSHSLGVFHLMHVCVNHLKKEYPKQITAIDEKALLAVALLHDIGHSPFSHATEKLFGDHEQRGVKIITDPSSDVNKILAKKAKSLPNKVASLMAEKPIAKTKVKLWQKSLISSQLDMDRLDYLRRDSLFSGAEYGNFDMFRIIHTMQLQERKLSADRPQKEIYVVWPDKSKYALEEYIFSRFYMYQSVYFHHTTRGYESLLRTVLNRAKYLGVKKKTFAKNILPSIRLLLEPDNTTDFQQLTDHMLFTQISIWQYDKDKILSDLCKRLLLRKGLSWIEVGGTFMQVNNKIDDAKKLLSKEKYDSDYYLIEDEMKTSVYNPYSYASSPDELSSANSILLYDSDWSDTHFKEITDAPGLDRLKSITKNQSAILRFYFPTELSKKLKTIFKG